MKIDGFPKTSGSEGLHVYIPLPPGTPYEAGMLFCQIIATMVAAKHPKVATVERMVRRRKDGTIFGAFVSKKRLEVNGAGLDDLIAEFHALGLGNEDQNPVV